MNQPALNELKPQDHKILIVDDDQDICEIMAAQANQLGYDTLSCFDGDEAIQKAREQRFTAVVTDVVMNKMNGHEFVKKLHKNGVFIPVAFVSGYLTPDHLILSTRLGAVDVLMKPFSQVEFSGMLHKLIAIGTRHHRINDLLYKLGSTEESKLNLRQVVEEIKNLQRQVSMLRTFEGSDFVTNLIIPQ
jgi:two-component system alkaline phosphatase synthesis response regulator PhoP